MEGPREATDRTGGVSRPKISQVGVGSYLAVERTLLHGQAVAIKRLRPDLYELAEEVESFVREIDAIAEFDHPSIARILEVGFRSSQSSGEGGRLSGGPENMFVFQEFCGGGSLQDKVLAEMASEQERCPRTVYTYSDAVRWCGQVAAGVAYLHSRQPMVLHRDLRLKRMLLTDTTDGAVVKLVDFRRISRASSPGFEVVARDLSGQRKSLLNMAPEVLLGLTYNDKADIFSLGCCMYELFAKKMTFTELSTNARAMDYRHVAAMTSRGYRRHIPSDWAPALKTLIVDCWKHDPEERPSAAEVAATLGSAELASQVLAWDSTEKTLMDGCCTAQ